MGYYLLIQIYNNHRHFQPGGTKVVVLVLAMRVRMSTAVGMPLT